MEPFPSLIFSFDGSFLVLHLSSFSAKKDITPEISNKQFFFVGVGCFLFSKKGRKRALACVPHQINKFYVRTAYLFWGGDFLWRGALGERRGECFFLFSSASSSFFLLLLLLLCPFFDFLKRLSILFCEKRQHSRSF